AVRLVSLEGRVPARAVWRLPERGLVERFRARGLEPVEVPLQRADSGESGLDERPARVLPPALPRRFGVFLVRLAALRANVGGESPRGVGNDDGGGLRGGIGLFGIR